jgi:hypothetical protein
MTSKPDLTSIGPASLRAGDVVVHLPSHEHWCLAYGDDAARVASACGWPESRVPYSDLLLFTPATDEKHADTVDAWLSRPHRRDDGSEDHRVGAVRRLYGRRATSEAARRPTGDDRPRRRVALEPPVDPDDVPISQNTMRPLG